MLFRSSLLNNSTSLFLVLILLALFFLFYQHSHINCRPIDHSIAEELFFFKEKPFSQCKSINYEPYKLDDYTLSVRNIIKDLKGIRLPQNSSTIRPFIRNKSYYRVAPKYNLSACIVEKAMCTLTQSIFCYLYDSAGFVQNNRTIPSENWEGRFCENRNEIHNTQEKRLLFPSNAPTIFMIREPIERFISAFTDKCINENLVCFDCKGDILCAVEKFHAEIMKINAEHWDVTVPKLSYISQTIETQHMVPANWMCDLFEESDNYIFVKYGETPEELQDMYLKLKKIYLGFGVEETYSEFIMNKKTSHATKSSQIRKEYSDKLRRSPSHLKLLNEIYEFDYKIFEYNPL